MSALLSERFVFVYIGSHDACLTWTHSNTGLHLLFFIWTVTLAGRLCIIAHSWSLSLYICKASLICFLWSSFETFLWGDINCSFMSSFSFLCSILSRKPQCTSAFCVFCLFIAVFFPASSKHILIAVAQANKIQFEICGNNLRIDWIFVVLLCCRVTYASVRACSSLCLLGLTPWCPWLEEVWGLCEQPGSHLPQHMAIISDNEAQPSTAK